MNKLVRISVLIVFLVVLIDQIVKIWVKTHMFIGESSFHHWGWSFQWFQLAFTENPGMAFGWGLPGTWGKIILSTFRILAIGGMIWILKWLIDYKKPKTGLIVCVSLILAGAIGNMIDCMFYGLIFSGTGYAANTVAEIFPAGGGYAPFLQGKVVDMLYFPMIDTVLPEWVPFWGGKNFVFFSPIFNIADAAVTVGVILLLIFQKRFDIKNITGEKEKPQS